MRCRFDSIANGRGTALTLTLRIRMQPDVVVLILYVYIGQYSYRIDDSFGIMSCDSYLAG